MKKLLFLFAFQLSALALFAQSPAVWSYGIPMKEVKIPVVNGTKIVYMTYHGSDTVRVPDFAPGKKFKTTVLFEEVVPVINYDTTWTAQDFNDVSTSIVYSPGWAIGTGNAKFYNGDFHYGVAPVIARTAILTVVTDKPTRIEYYTERFAGHGIYTIKVNSDPAITINAGLAPFNSDRDRGAPSYRTPILPAGTHTITVSSSAQVAVDLIRIQKLTLTPRP